MRTTNDYRPTTALSRHLKIHSAIVIHLDRGGKIELGERNLLPGSVVIEHPERSTGDRVVSYFFNMLVAEDQRRRGDTGGPFILARLRAARIQILIPLSLPVFLLAQPLFFDAQRVHLAGKRQFAILIIVIRGRRVPPPVRIVVARIAVSGIPRIPEAPPATEAVMKTARANAPSTKTVSAKRRTSADSGMQSGVHSAEGVAARSASNGASNGNAVTAARSSSNCASNRNAASATGSPHAATLGRCRHKRYE